jgi:hypothetical protein
VSVREQKGRRETNQMSRKLPQERNTKEMNSYEYFSNPLIQDLFKKLWAKSIADKEIAAWIYQNKLPPLFDMTPPRIGGDSHAKVGVMPPNAVLQVHTHPQTYKGPFNSALSAEPSIDGGSTGRGDWGVAIASGRPVYVLSVLAIWKILPDPSKPRKVQVAGQWV